MKEKLHVEAVAVDGMIWLYTLSGFLCGSSEGYAFQEDLREKIGSGGRKFILDLKGVDRIDSSGIGILVTVAFSAYRSGGSLVMAALSPRVKEILGITMLLERIASADTVDEAKRRLSA